MKCPKCKFEWTVIKQHNSYEKENAELFSKLAKTVKNKLLKLFKESNKIFTATEVNKFLENANLYDGNVINAAIEIYYKEHKEKNLAYIIGIAKSLQKDRELVQRKQGKAWNLQN